MQIALGTVTVMSLLMTLAMGVVTWRLVRDERRRSAARLAVLTSRLREQAGPGRPAMSPLSEERERARPIERSEETGTMSWSWGLAGLAASGLVAIAVVALLPIGGAEKTTATPVPLELLALDHDRHDGELAITGTVRNPANGEPQPRLAVHATAFDDAGTVVATRRSLVSDGALAAGDESAFDVSLAAETATRYRISFMIDEGTVPHLDRRAATAPTPDAPSGQTGPQETGS